jgi:hypothetical protein
MTTARERRLPIGPILVVLMLAALLGSISYAAIGRLPPCQFVAASQCTRALFIGNSYTFVNDLPGMFTRLAASGHHPVDTAMYAPGGAFLSDAASKPEVTSLINGTKWTAVVLQEQSQLPANAAQATTTFIPAAARLSSMALADGARPYLLETWAHRDGWPELGQDYAAMQRAINASYAAAAQGGYATLVPAGEAWQRAIAAGLTAQLWQDDGSHPAVAGTYLAACALYQAVFGESPVGLADHEGLSDDLAAKLQQIAAAGG